MIKDIFDIERNKKRNIKNKKFPKYLEKRLDKDGVAEIEELLLEIKILQSMQESISDLRLSQYQS